MTEHENKKLNIDPGFTLRPRVIVITGPTATGKSGCAVRLAKEIGGEIISADSMQVYRGMDIGSAKITKEEMQAEIIFSAIPISWARKCPARSPLRTS